MHIHSTFIKCELFVYVKTMNFSVKITIFSLLVHCTQLLLYHRALESRKQKTMIFCYPPIMMAPACIERVKKNRGRFAYFFSLSESSCSVTLFCLNSSLSHSYSFGGDTNKTTTKTPRNVKKMEFFLQNLQGQLKSSGKWKFVSFTFNKQQFH